MISDIPRLDELVLLNCTVPIDIGEIESLQILDEIRCDTLIGFGGESPNAGIVLRLAKRHPCHYVFDTLRRNFLQSYFEIVALELAKFKTISKIKRV